MNEDDTAGCCHNECACTDDEDEDGVPGEELGCLGGATYGETEEHHHNVVEGRACSLGEACGLGGLLEEITEEEHAEQGQT